MNELTIKIAREHERLQALIDSSITCMNGDVSLCPNGTCSHRLTCRQSIRAKLHAYLSLSIVHFKHEHEAMKEANTPQEIFEAHAQAHSKITDQINQVIAQIDVIKEARLIEHIQHLGDGLREHIHAFDRF